VHDEMIETMSARSAVAAVRHAERTPATPAASVIRHS